GSFPRAAHPCDYHEFAKRTIFWALARHLARSPADFPGDATKGHPARNVSSRTLIAASSCACAPYAKNRECASAQCLSALTRYARVTKVTHRFAANCARLTQPSG